MYQKLKFKQHMSTQEKLNLLSQVNKIAVTLDLSAGLGFPVFENLGYYLIPKTPFHFGLNENSGLTEELSIGITLILMLNEMTSEIEQSNLWLAAKLSLLCLVSLLYSKYLMNRSYYELKQIFQAIPTHIDYLDLNNNALSQRFTNKELEEALSELPKNVKIVYFDGRVWYRDMLYLAFIHETTENFIAQFKNKPMFEPVKPPMSIDENKLSNIIQILETSKNDSSYLSCGLLLDGQIETMADEPYGPKEFEEYMEKRLHDAISFFSKIGMKSEAFPLAKFLLWQIKLMPPLKSIQQRLAAYDLDPDCFTHALHQGFKKRDSVKITLLKSIGVFKTTEKQARKIKAETLSLEPEVSYRPN